MDQSRVSVSQPSSRGSHNEIMYANQVDVTSAPFYLRHFGSGSFSAVCVLSVREKNERNAVGSPAITGTPGLPCLRGGPTAGRVSALTAQGNGGFHVLMRLGGFLFPFADHRGEESPIRRGRVRLGGSTDGRRARSPPRR